MSVKNVLLDLLCYHIGVTVKGGVELISQFSCYLVAYMYQLPEIRVIERVLTVMAQCTCILLTAPCGNLFCSREIGLIDVNYGGVGDT